MESMNIAMGQRISLRIIELRQELAEKRSHVDFSINRIQSMNLMEEKTMENLMTLSRLIQHLTETINVGEKVRIFAKDSNYLKWAEDNIPQQQLEAMRMSDEVALLVMKQTAKNVITRMNKTERLQSLSPKTRLS